MARTYEDLLKFQAMYGIPPEQSAGAFGVDLPPPPADPMVAGRPPLPPAPEPVLVAGNEKPANQDWLLDATGKPVSDIPVGPLLGGGAAPKIVPTPMDAPVQPDVKALADAAYRKQELAPGRPAPMVLPPPKPKAEDASKSTQDDLAAAQALEANALGAGAGAPRRAVGLSPGQSMAAVDKLTGFDRGTHEQNVLQQEAADQAQTGVFDAKADAATKVGRAWATLAATDRNAAAAEEARIRDEEMRQAQAEQELKAAQSRIMAKPKDDTERKIGGLASFIMAGIANAISVGAGGKPSDVMEQMLARQDANDDKEYQRKLQQVQALKVDDAQKNARMRQLEADKIAAYGRRRENAIQGFQSVFAANEANLTDAQKKAYEEQVMALRGQQMEAFDSGRKQLAYKLQVQAAQAANQPGALRGESNQKALAQFVPTGAGGRGYVAIGDDAKGIRERMQWAQAMDQNLANVHQGLERWKAMGASRLDPTDPKRIALENDIKGEMTAYTKNLSNAQKQGVVREWEQNDDHMKDATALMSNLARGDAYAEAAIENAKLMRRRLAGQVDAVARVSKAYDAQRATAPDGTAAIIPLGAGSDAAPLAGVPGLKR